MSADELREQRRRERRERETRILAVSALVAFLALLVLVVVVASARGDDTPPPPPPPATYRGLTAEQWAAVAARARARANRAEVRARDFRRRYRAVRDSLRERVRVSASGPVAGLLCIHRYEGAWDDPGHPYYGGLQMDVAFQRAYGRSFYERLGTANVWPPFVQVAVGLAAYYERGFAPWPNTRKLCGV